MKTPTTCGHFSRHWNLIETVFSRWIQFCDDCRVAVAELPEGHERPSGQMLEPTPAEALHDLMSAISGEHWGEGWHKGTGEELWWIVGDGCGDWGEFHVLEETVERLCCLAELAGGWWAGCDEFVPLADACTRMCEEDLPDGEAESVTP